jgi:uncharacterized protein YdaU (DUF1376 family)
MIGPGSELSPESGLQRMTMHWYKRNIGDYAKKAGKLTMLQHGSYTLLLDACYDREQFPTLEQAIEWVWASTPDEIDALKFVLSRFFIHEKDGTYTQSRVLDELLDYHGKADKNKQIAIDRETKRRENRTNRARTVNDTSPDVHEPPPNQEPVTKNHQPKNTSATAQPDGVCESVWQDFLKTRKAKKAPVTDTAIDGIRREAGKAGVTLEQALKTCCERGWTGFKAEWLTETRKTFAADPAVTMPSRQGVDPALAKAIKDSLSGVKPSDEIRKRMAQITGVRA